MNKSLKKYRERRWWYINDYYCSVYHPYPYKHHGELPKELVAPLYEALTREAKILTTKQLDK